MKTMNFLILPLFILSLISINFAYAQSPLPAEIKFKVIPPEGVAVQDQSFNLGIPGLDVAAIAALAFKTIRDELKTKNISSIIRRIAGTQVKQIEVQEGTLEQVYDNMPQKGNEITNKEVIKQDNVKDIKAEAIKTASEA